MKRLKQENIHTAVDTSGFVSRDSIDKVKDYTDVFLYDIKAFDETVHHNCTGQNNEIIKNNLEYIDSKDKLIEIRIPVIPKLNYDEMDRIAQYLIKFKNIKQVRLLEYHNYAGNKYESIGMKYETGHITKPTKDMMDEVKNKFSNFGIKCVD